MNMLSITSYPEEDDERANKDTDALQQVSNHMHKGSSHTGIFLCLLPVPLIFRIVVVSTMAMIFLLSMAVAMTMRRAESTMTVTMP